jgi:hypothetical protein
VKVRFIKDPTGKYNLCYEIGEEIDLPDAQAKELIEDSYAVPTELPKPENSTSKRKIEKR